MKPEDVDLLKNPIFLILVIPLVILIYVYQVARLKRSQKEDKDKIVGFFPRGLGIIPVRESFYNIWDRNRIVSIVILGLFFVFFPIFWGGMIITHEGFYWEVLGLMIGMPLVFVGVLYYGWLYKRAKEKGKDLTGAEMNWIGFINLLRGNDANVKATLRCELLTIIAIVGFILILLVKFFTTSL